MVELAGPLSVGAQSSLAGYLVGVKLRRGFRCRVSVLRKRDRVRVQNMGNTTNDGERHNEQEGLDAMETK